MPNKLKYAAAVRVLHAGGTTRAEGDALVFDKCDHLILLVDARTNYKPDYQAGWRGEDPLPAIEKELAAAEAKSYDDLRARRISRICRASWAG